MKKREIIEAQDLPEGDEVFLIKRKSGYDIVYPNIHPKTGKRNWANTLYGGKKNLTRLLMYMAIAMIVFYGMNELVSQYRHAAENPCLYCPLSPQHSLDLDVERSLTRTGGLDFSNVTVRIEQDLVG